MRVDVTVECNQPLTMRMRQVCSMFDAPPSDKTTRSWQLDAPIEERPWQIGLIVGPSGCGKTTIARKMFGEPAQHAWPRDASVIDGFDKQLGIEAIAAICGAVGFNTIPAWLRPYDKLSNGERFRVDLARTLADARSGVRWVDEFTSVVDRQVAKIGAHAVQKYVRKTPGAQFVAASCHYDIVDWLQPDWVLEPATGTFAWRSLQRRPSIEVDIKRVPYATWALFAPYYYLTAELHHAAACFAAHVEGRPVAFAGILPFPHAKVRDIRRCSRLVTLPDWQGLGLAFVLIDALAALYKTIGYRMRCYPAHPALVRAFEKNPSWSVRKEAGTFSPRLGETSSIPTSQQQTHPTMGGWQKSTGMGSRPCGVYEWVGAAGDSKKARFVVGRA